MRFRALATPREDGKDSTQTRYMAPHGPMSFDTGRHWRRGITTRRHLPLVRAYITTTIKIPLTYVLASRLKNVSRYLMNIESYHFGLSGIED